MPAPSEAKKEGQQETGRVEAFSDGVFGVAITLLIFQIKTPAPGDLSGRATLADALFGQWPVYVSYLTSFLTVLIMWINHHRMFRHVRRSDDNFLMLNGLLLMTVTIVPFPTQVLSTWFGHEGERAAAVLYSGCFVLIALTFNVLWRYASHRGRLLGPGHNPSAVAEITKRYRFGPLLYVIAFGLAFFSAIASTGMCIGLAVFFALPARQAEAITSPSD